MQHAPHVGKVNRSGDGGQNAGRFARRQRPFGQPLGQRRAADILHAEIRPAVDLADFIDRHDARMIELRGRLGLRLEPLRDRPASRAGRGGSSSRRLRGPGSIARPDRPRPCRRGPVPAATHNRQTAPEAEMNRSEARSPAAASRPTTPNCCRRPAPSTITPHSSRRSWQTRDARRHSASRSTISPRCTRSVSSRRDGEPLFVEQLAVLACAA